MVPSATVEPNAPGAARPSPPNDPTQVTQFHGLNQRLDPTRLGPEWALQADNVLCDDARFYVRRPGYAAVRAGVKDAFAAGPNTLWVVDAADRLLALGPTGETAALATGFIGAPFRWMQFGSVTFCQSQSTSAQWAIYPDRVVPWGIPLCPPPTLGTTTGTLPAATYLAAAVYVAEDGRVGGCAAFATVTLTGYGGITVAPPVRAGYATRVYLGTPDSTELLEYTTTTTPFTLHAVRDFVGLSLPLRSLDCYPPPVGQVLGVAGNQVVVGVWEPQQDRTTLFFSRPDYPHWFPLTSEFLMIPGRVTLLAWTPARRDLGAALVIGTETAIYERVNGKLMQLAAYGAPAHAAVTLDAGDVAFWTQRGLCAATPFRELTADRLLPALREVATAARFSWQGSEYVLVAQQGAIRPSPCSPRTPMPITTQHRNGL